MLHACVQRFNVMENLEKFDVSGELNRPFDKISNNLAAPLCDACEKTCVIVKEQMRDAGGVHTDSDTPR